MISFSFFTLFFKLLPLYFIILLGYIGGKRFGIQLQDLSRTLLYLVSPLVVFGAIYLSSLPIQATAIIPMFLAVSILVTVLSYVISYRFMPDSRSNLLALGISAPNVGYYGVPVVEAILGHDALATHILIMIAAGLCVHTVGHFYVARSAYSVRESVLRVLRMPIPWMAALAFLLRATPLRDSPSFNHVIDDVFQTFKAAFSLLGVMMIGIAIGRAKQWRCDLPLLLLTLVAKYLLFPFFIYLLIAFDTATFQLLNDELHHLLIISAFVPVGTSMVIYAAFYSSREDEAASTLLISSLVSLILIPLAVWIFIG